MTRKRNRLCIPLMVIPFFRLKVVKNIHRQHTLFDLNCNIMWLDTATVDTVTKHQTALTKGTFCIGNYKLVLYITLSSTFAFIFFFFLPKHTRLQNWSYCVTWPLPRTHFLHLSNYWKRKYFHCDFNVITWHTNSSFERRVSCKDLDWLQIFALFNFY